jgi:catalase
MAFQSQGNRPNYQSSILPLSYRKKAYSTASHEQFVGSALADLSEVTELDFEQPRALWERVFDEGAKERFVGNVAAHLSGAKSEEIKKRQRKYPNAVQ